MTLPSSITTPTSRPTSQQNTLFPLFHDPGPWMRQRTLSRRRFGKMFRWGPRALFFSSSFHHRSMMMMMIIVIASLLLKFVPAAPRFLMRTPLAVVVSFLRRWRFCSTVFFVVSFGRGTSHSLYSAETLEWYMHGRLGCEVWRAKRGNLHTCLHIHMKRTATV